MTLEDQLREEKFRQDEVKQLKFEISTCKCQQADELCGRCSFKQAKIYELTGRRNLIDSTLNQ